MSEKVKPIELGAFWEQEAKKGGTFHVSNKMTFGELRNLLKDFKEQEDVNDADQINFLMFDVNSDHERAPKYRVIIKKDTYKKGE